jgi:hypothetical protein
MQAANILALVSYCGVDASSTSNCNLHVCAPCFPQGFWLLRNRPPTGRGGKLRFPDDKHRKCLVACNPFLSYSSNIMLYKISRIPKGNGKFREIYVPSKEYKQVLSGFIPELEKILGKFDKHGVNYAFLKGKNCALNALQHIGYRYTLSMDLEDFFDSIKISHVVELLPNDILEKCFIDGSPKQGLPTSPLISNIAFLCCDNEIVQALEKLVPKFVYSRYADDLIISFNDFSYLHKISFVVKQAVERNGFKVNSVKTKIQDQSNGRIVVTGIAIGMDGLSATRRIKRKIRAAVHQGNKESEKGLLEWAKCKLPNNFFN